MDKGLLKERDKTWSQIAVEKLSSLPLHSVVSINSSQQGSYSVFFFNDQLIIDKELNAKGPLLGLLSVHSQFINEDMLILGCDLARMELSVLRSLMSEYKQFPQFESYVFTNGSYVEPLCGIYTSSGIAKIFKAVREGNLSSNRMRDALDLLNTKYLPLKEESRTYFQNFNTPADLN